MLRGCESLISIDLSNFDTSEVVNMGELFHECRNLQYINLKNFKDTKNPITTDIFKAIAKNVAICINSAEASKIYDIARKIECVNFSCEENWPFTRKKVDIDRG